MRDLAGFRKAIEQYRKQVGCTEEELARELYISKGELNKRLHDYHHPQSQRTWRLKPEHVKKIVETLAKWGAVTSQKQAFALFTQIGYPSLQEEIDWQTSPWNRLHLDASKTEPHPILSLPVRRRLFQARDLPKDYVPRPNAFNEIKHLLLIHEENQTTAITTTLRGAGGFGKTTLASALCHDPDIQAAFPDGILWVELGEHPPRSLDVLNEMLHTLEPTVVGAITLEEARARWRKALEKRAYLLVIDDVWQTEALEELLKEGPRCGRLVTTRNDQLLPETAKRVWVDAMEPVEAMVLLCQSVVEDWQHTLDRAVLEHVVVQQLGCWPLLVSLARGMLTNQVKRLGKTPEQALMQIKQAYDDRGMAAFHLGDRIERQRTAEACVEVNLHQLEEWVPAHYQARQRYLEMAVFPEDTDISVTTLQIYWQGMGGLKEWEVEELCLHLSDLSLVLPWNPEHTTIRVHDVLRRYLIQRAGAQLPAWHERLLETYHHHYHLARWADLPQSETYLWKRLVSHLCQASNQEALQTTLTDLLYVTRAVQYQGVAALEADLVLATTSSLEKGAGKPSADLVSLHRRIGGVHHLLQQVSTEAEIGGLVLCSLHEEATLLPQRQALEQVLPRPFLTTWHPLPQASSSVLRTLSGHTDAVNACRFSPDGRWIVSASSDETLKVWEAATGTQVRTISGHTKAVNSCGFSPDGRWIVSASSDCTLKVWETATEVQVRTISGHTKAVNSCGFSPDGRWIVSASSDCTLKVWETATGAEVRTLRGHTRAVNGCAISPDGQWIASASGDQTLKVWEAATGAEVRTLRGHTHWVYACAISPDGRWIVSASEDQTLKVWETATGAPVRTLRGHTHSVRACVFSPDGQWIVSASWDMTLKVWEAATGAEVRTLSGHISMVFACAISPDGKWIVSASYDQTLKVWEAATGVISTVRPKQPIFHDNSEKSTWDRYFSRLYSGIFRHGIQSVWAALSSFRFGLSMEIPTGAEVSTLSGHTHWVKACAFSPDGQWIVSAFDDCTLKVWEAATGAEVRTLRGHTSSVLACGFSPDGKWIVSASDDHTLKVWEAATGAERRTLSGHTHLVLACGFSPDGKWIVSASYDLTLKVWKAATGAEVRILRGHTSTVRACRFSPDGKWIVSASDDQTLKVWDSTTGAEVRTLSGHTSGVRACGFSPDGKWIVSASHDQTLKMWNSSSGAQHLTLSGHTGAVNACGFSPDGKWTVSASDDGTLKVWEATSGQCVLTFPVDGDLLDSAFHPDGEHLVTCGKGGMYFLRLVQ